MEIGVDTVRPYVRESICREASQFFVPFLCKNNRLFFQTDNLVSLWDLFHQDKSPEEWIRVLDGTAQNIKRLEEFFLEDEVDLSVHRIFWNSDLNRILFMPKGNDSLGSASFFDLFTDLREISVRTCCENAETVLFLHCAVAALSQCISLPDSLEEIGTRWRKMQFQKPECITQSLEAAEKPADLVFRKSRRSGRKMFKHGEDCGGANSML